MDFWIRAAQLMLSLAILITLHEFGHYIAARIFKIRVEKFYLFFDPWFSLFKKKIGQTEWGVGWLPLGGYVKIAGMIDESMDKEQMAQPPKEDEFRSKPAWQRLIVMIGGVTVNVILGFFIYIVVIAAWGETVLENDKLKYGLAVHPSLKAEYPDLEDGMIITAIDGQPLENVNLINIKVFFRGARSLTVQLTDGTEKEVVLYENIDDFMWENDAIMAFTPRVPTYIDSLSEGRSIVNSGLQKGDQIISINGKQTEYFHLLQHSLSQLEGDSALVSIGYLRNEDTLTADVWAKESDGVYTLGFFNRSPDFLVPTTKNYSFGKSIKKGIQKAGWTMHDYAAQLPLFFTSKGAQSMGGFGAIGSLFPTTWDWERFWLNTAFISLILAIMNILPIPALDGGHIVFLLYEMITGKEAPQKVLEIAQVVGFVLLLGLLIFANGNDIYRAFFK